MFTEKEEEIINAAVERTLLAIPEVIGNLMSNHAALHKINLKFYTDHPEFKDKKDVVQSVVEWTEGKNTLLDYEEILKLAVPEIQKRLAILQNVNVDKVSTDMPVDYKHVDFLSNGEL